MKCNKRDVLFEEYRNGVAQYSESVMALRAGSGAREFEELFRSSEQIRIACECARRALERHRKEHGC